MPEMIIVDESLEFGDYIAISPFYGVDLELDPVLVGINRGGMVMNLQPGLLHDVVNPCDASPDVVKQVRVVENSILHSITCEVIHTLT